MSPAGESGEAIVLVKSASQPGMPVYCAAITPEGTWVRLSPISFRRAPDANQFKRWDRIKYRYLPGATDDMRQVVAQTVEITGELLQDERQDFLAPLQATSLNGEGGLRLLRAREPKFFITRKNEKELADERAADASKPPLPYKFRFQYVTDEGVQESTYQDPEMNHTFTNLTKSFGEAQTVARIMQLYGKEYPQRGMFFALSKQAKGDWLITGLIGMNEIEPARQNLDLVV